MTNCFGYKYLGYGLGLRYPHYDYILDARPKNVDFFEIISENFIEAHNGYWEFLKDLSTDYPIIMHGVSMSIGSTDPLNISYLNKLRKLADFINAPWISDHLCWTGINGINSHDLLPIPYTKDSLTHIINMVVQAQDILQRNILLENPSSYVEFSESVIPEWEFLAMLAEKANCGILLDVNNIYVSSVNHNFDAKKYIDTIPKDRVVQIHLAGHKNLGTHIIDTHDNYVIDEVWDLYKYTLKTFGNITTMIEWDSNIPEYSVLTAELDKARNVGLSLNEAA